MAGTDKQAEGGRTSRVYKASAVHKRRPGRKATQGASRVVPDADRELATGPAEVEPENAAAEPGATGSLRAVAAEGAPAKSQAAEEAKSPAFAESPSSAAQPESAEEQGVGDAGVRAEEGHFETQPANEEAFEEPEAAPADIEPSRPSARKAGKLRAKGVVIALIALVVLAAVVIASGFAWNRWGRFDDHADMLGDWYVEGTATPVLVDEETIQLAANIVYDYEIDDHDKTIRYTFGSWEGQGRYRFSEDRTRLAITDGTFSGPENTIDDLVQSFESLEEASGADAPSLPDGNGVIVLSREPDPEALAAREAAEKAAQIAERKKALADESADGDEDTAGLDSAEPDFVDESSDELEG